MAKKKKAKRTTKKKTTKARAKKKKTSSGSRKKSTAKKPAARRPANTSVDSLLKKFARDRVQKENQLGVIVKKREELQTKTQKLQEQIAKVTQQQREIESQLSRLDQERDREVKQLLAELGIKLESSGGHSGPSAPHTGSDRGKSHREQRLGTLTNGRDD